MAVGSCAMGAREPRQVRKEAAISGNSCVPQGCLQLRPDRKITFRLLAVAFCAAMSGLFVYIYCASVMLTVVNNYCRQNFYCIILSEVFLKG